MDRSVVMAVSLAPERGEDDDRGCFRTGDEPPRGYHYPSRSRQHEPGCGPPIGHALEQLIERGEPFGRYVLFKKNIPYAVPSPSQRATLGRAGKDRI
jgi:hypothetical protein